MSSRVEAYKNHEILKCREATSRAAWFLLPPIDLRGHGHSDLGGQHGYSKEKEAANKRQYAGEPGADNDAAPGVRDCGDEAYVQSEQAISGVYDKAAQTVNEKYELAKNYSRKNPDKAILIALGIGAGLGYLLCATSRTRAAVGLPNPWSTRSLKLLWSFSANPLCFRKKTIPPFLRKTPGVAEMEVCYA